MGRRAEIERFVSYKLSYLIEISGQGEGAGMLAVLRKGIGHEPGEIPELFGVLLTDMPGEFMSKGTAPTREEWACYISLTLYAMHQQGNDPQKDSAHSDREVSIGSAMLDYVRLSDDGNARSRMAAKLQMLSSSKDMAEFSYHLRSIIKLLKTKGISLNYAQLAGDIYDFQLPGQKAGVFLKWGQDFYRNVTVKENEENGGTNS